MKQVLNPGALICLVWMVLSAAPAWTQAELSTPGKALSLPQCIELALKYHPALTAAQETVAAQKARVEQALANYYPQIDLQSSYQSSTANYANRYLAGRADFRGLFAVGPALNLLIYDFGRTAGVVRISRENVTAGREDLRTVRQNVVLGVKESYFSVLQALALIRVAEETRTQNRRRLEQAEGFYRAGARPKIDVTKAEVDLANVELALIGTRNNYQLTRVRLNNAMGLRENLNFAIDETVDFKPVTISLNEILKNAYANRPEILQLKAQQRGQKAAVELARAGYFPTISGNLNNVWRTDEPPNDPSWDMSVGASLTWPLFSGFSTSHQIAEAKANLRNLLALEESLHQNIRLEAEQAFLNYQEAVQRIAVTQKAVEQARENYELASGRYRVGIGGPLEINDAEVSLANARASHISALYDYKIAEAQIEKAAGTDLPDGALSEMPGGPDPAGAAPGSPGSP